MQQAAAHALALARAAAAAASRVQAAMPPPRPPPRPVSPPTPDSDPDEPSNPPPPPKLPQPPPPPPKLSQPPPKPVVAAPLLRAGSDSGEEGAGVDAAPPAAPTPSLRGYTLTVSPYPGMRLRQARAQQGPVRARLTRGRRAAG
jgi:hypothetical protein